MGVEQMLTREKSRESLEVKEGTESYLSPEQKEKVTDEKNKQKLDETKITLESFSSRIDNAKNEKDDTKKGNDLIMLYIVLERHQKEIQEITGKSNPRTMDIIKLGEGLDQKCDTLKGEIMSDGSVDKEKLNTMLSESFGNMDNKDFLKQFSKDQRLEKITKPPKEAKDVKSGDDIRFTFTFQNKLNENLYLKTTAGQVLPSEVKEVESGGKKYFRKSLEGEFFTDSNERLIIHDNTIIRIGDLRSKINNSRFISSGEDGKTYEDDIESVEYLEKVNQEKIKKYRISNPDSDINIVTGAINRGIDPKFAQTVFGDLIKGKTDQEEIKVILEDAFTEFDRSRGKVEASMTMEGKKQVTEGDKTTEGGRYDENLVITLLKALFPGLWKSKAIESGFSDEELNHYEGVSNTKIDFSASNGEVSKMIDKTSESLSIDKKLIKAILMQESSGNMSATRFEKHVYDREIKKGTPQDEAKLLATSFGGFQIMGFNYKVCGYSSVKEFVEAMKSPEEQFNAFSKFVKANDTLYRAMKKDPPDFQTIAYNYNGPGYAQNRYDSMIEKRFNSLA